MAQSANEETLALLARLSQKPGVQSTLILSRSNGAIVRASGLLSRDIPSDSEAAPQTSAQAPPSKDTASGAGGISRSAENGAPKSGLKNAEDVARLVWSFFGAAGGMVDEMMGTEDEVRLLRLRTKRNELVIVPDPKFLLVCVHDTPSA